MRIPMSANDLTQHAFSSTALSSTRDPSPLSMDADTFYHLGLLAVELATEYLEGIPGKPVFRSMTPSERQMLLHQPLPKYGRSPEALFDFFEQHILPHAMGNQHPRFAAWVNPAGAPIGMLAEFLEAVVRWPRSIAWRWLVIGLRRRTAGMCGKRGCKASIRHWSSTFQKKGIAACARPRTCWDWVSRAAFRSMRASR